MFCGKCGTENPDDTKYCLKCGADLKKMRTPPPRGIKSIGEKPTAGDKVSTTDFRHSIGEMKTILSDEDISLLFDKSTLISDRYEIKALLGKGGMGVVYQVYDRLLGEEAALKMMLPSLIRTEKAIERFINEAKISLKLSHENIVRIRDIGEFKGIRYISMEYLVGSTLRELLAEKKKSGEVFSLSEALRIIFQICDSLAYAHKYTVHRDIKPENIMIMPDGKVKIMDFGIAKLMSRAQFTTTSVSMGTAYYMAPEQSTAPIKVDHRADIYSVGVILHEMLTSNIPMGSFQFPSKINPNLPEEIDDIIEIALRPLPEERYQKIEELKKDLDDMVNLVPDLQKELKEKPKAVKERVIRRPRKAADLETDRIICPNCQTINSREKYYCVNCGGNLKGKCPQCKSNIDVDLTYCGKCGVNIAKYRENLISGYVKSAKEHIAKQNFDLVNKEIEKIERVDRKHPAIAQIHNLIKKEKDKLTQIEKLISSAEDLLQQKSYDRAFEQAAKVLELDKNNPEALQIVEKISAILNQIEKIKKEAENNLKSRRYIEALKLYEQLKELKPKDKTVENRIDDIKLKIAEEKAKALRRKLIAAMVIIVIASGIIAVRLLKIAHNRYLDVIEEAYNMAVSLQQDGKYIQAEGRFKQFLAQYPDSKYVTDVNLRLDNIKEKVAVLKTEENKLIQEADILFNKRQFSIPADNNAVKKYKQVLNINPGNQHAKDRLELISNFYLEKAKEAYNNKRYLSPPDDNVLKYINNILSFDSNNKLALNMKKKIGAHYQKQADNSRNAKDFKAAKRYYQLLRVIYPDDLSIEQKINQCNVEIEQQEFTLAQSNDTISSWQEFIENYPNSWHTPYARNRLKELKEEADFNLTKRIDSLASWQEFFAKYRGSTYADYAWRRIIDLSPWIMFQHDLHHTGRSLYNGPEIQHLKWTFLTGGAVYSSPAVGADGTIYIGSYDGKLYAINPDGSQKWAFATGERIGTCATIGADSTIYIGSSNGKLYTIDPNGSKKWSFGTGNAIWSSPAIGADGTIYMGSSDGRLYAVKPDGSTKWKFSTRGSIESSPAIGSNDTLYVGSSDGRLYAVNPYGSEKWGFSTGGSIGSSPAIGVDGTIYLGSSDGRLYAINPYGSEKWEFSTGGRIVSSPAIGTDGTIYVGSSDGKLYAINPDGSSKWEFSTGSSIASSPAIGADGTIYVGSYDGKLYALNSDGSRKWVFTTGGRIGSSPAIGADLTIYVGSLDGKLYAIGEK